MRRGRRCRPAQLQRSSVLDRRRGSGMSHAVTLVLSEIVPRRMVQNTFGLVVETDTAASWKSLQRDRLRAADGKGEHLRFHRAKAVRSN